MIESVLPHGVVSAEAFGELRGTLYPAEVAATSSMRPARRAEFVTGRVCARRALARLGHPDAPLPRGPHGAPRWPVGTVGSITHCPGYRGAVAVREGAIMAIGVDAEPHLPLPSGVLESILSDDDERRRQDAFADTFVHVDRMLFCAKEAVFKAWFPLMGRNLAWRDVAVSFSKSGVFTARIDAARGLDDRLWKISGRWLVTGRFIVTAVTVDASGSPR